MPILHTRHDGIAIPYGGVGEMRLCSGTRVYAADLADATDAIARRVVSGECGWQHRHMEAMTDAEFAARESADLADDHDAEWRFA